MQIKDIALDLYSIIDDIDTCSDIAKDDDKLYRRLVGRLAQKRHEYADCDGFTVKFRETKMWEDEDAPLEGVTKLIFTRSGRKIIIRQVE